ncbi:hypothetical protein [Thermovirga lienii]|uniref:hypothetical protein n=1 Tax=Thermovirga lienii TaxID=336261 RepID=UPI002FE418D9
MSNLVVNISNAISRLQDSHRLYPVQSGDKKRIRYEFCLITDAEDVRAELEQHASFMIKQVSLSGSDGFETYYKDLPVSAVRIDKTEDLAGILSVPPENLIERIQVLNRERGDKAAYTIPVENKEDGEVVTVPVGIFMFNNLAFWRELANTPSGFTYQYAVADKETISSSMFRYMLRRVGIDGIFLSLRQLLYQIHLPNRDNEVLHKMLTVEERCLNTLMQDAQKILDKQETKFRRWKIYSVTSGVLLAFLLGILVLTGPAVIERLQSLGLWFF